MLPGHCGLLAVRQPYALQLCEGADGGPFHCSGGLAHQADESPPNPALVFLSTFSLFLLPFLPGTTDHSERPIDPYSGSTHLVPVLGRQRQEDHCESDASLGIIKRSCRKKNIFPDTPTMIHTLHQFLASCMRERREGMRFYLRKGTRGLEPGWPRELQE